MPVTRASTNSSTSFINNEFVKAVDGKTFDVINPSTEEVICSVQEATEKDVDIAVAAARKAFNGPWRKETPENRGKLLNKLADLFEKNADLIAAVEALDNGKAFSMAKNVDVPAAAGCLRYYGGWADKIEGKVVDTAPDSFNYIRKEPVSEFSLNIQVLYLTLSDWCLRSNHPMELPNSHVVMEDWSCHRYW